MKAHALLALLLTACGGIGDLGSNGVLGDLVGDRADRHAEFEDLRQARKERMPLGGVARAGGCKKFKVPLAGVDPDRSLFVHDSATLDFTLNGGVDFSLRRVLTEMAAQADAAGAIGTTAESLFTSMWEAQSATAHPTGCPDGTGLLNGFTYDCRPEGNDQVLPLADPAAQIELYKPIAIVNRMDNIADDFSDCGEHRIVYGRTEIGPLGERNFIIFEGVLPNPLEGCKEGCRTVARWWVDLSIDPDPMSRALKLEQLFFRPLGVGPGKYRQVIHFDHYSVAGVDTNKLTAKGGQIRTNQRFTLPWQLKEYKTLLDCAGPCTASIIPVEVKANPFGMLFDVATASDPDPWAPLTPLLQADIIAQRDLIATGTSAADFTYEPDPQFNAGQGNVDGTSDYAGRADPQFILDIEAGGPANFTADQILNRVTALNCAGCHQPVKFDLEEDTGIGQIDTIGPGLSFPVSLDFVHTTEFEAVVLPATTVFGTGEGFPISPALIDVFLPFRAANLIDLVNTDVCVCTPAPLILAALSAGGRARQDAELRSAANELDAAIAAYDVIRADNDALEAAGIAVDRSDELAARDAVDAVVFNSGEAMLALLASEGVDEAMADDDAYAATPFRWSGKEPIGEAVQEALDAEPPRRTITGSFNVH